ncbi:MAG: EAL domain-containing protein, partial [Peptostreptococcaceae bacterium]
VFIVDVLIVGGSFISNNYSSINSAIKETIILQLSWFFGGNSVFFDYSNERMQYYIIIFAHIGGAGSTLSLIIAFKLLKKIKDKRKLIPNIGIVASIFNINEPIVYGLPIIFNPIYILPFILTPVVLTLVTYIAIKLNFISINNDVNWSMPIFLNAYILTNSFNGVILQVVNIIIGIVIYIPFVILSDKVYEVEVNDFYSDLKNKIFSNKLDGKRLTSLDDNIGIIARILAVDLSNDLTDSKRLYLQYQPQVDKNGVVVGVESLCRWNHKILGNIPPNIFIQIAEECDLMDELGRYIIKESCKQLKLWNKELKEPMEMSINVSASQLKDEMFYDYIKGTIENNNIDFKDIKLEITESLALGNDVTTEAQIKRLSDLDIKFAIDDFGQGYNPILYIKKYNISTLKLDGSLIKDIETNDASRYIVHAMYTLCENSGIKIVCEFVESYKQKSILDRMGNGIYQGYLFSQPLCGDDCLNYIKKSNVGKII